MIFFKQKLIKKKNSIKIRIWIVIYLFQTPQKNVEKEKPKLYDIHPRSP